MPLWNAISFKGCRLMNTIYVVTGLMRSGTTMMMHALKAGGMDVYHEPYHTERMKAMGKKDYYKDDYELLEVCPENMEDPNFPLMHKGKLIKVLAGKAARLRGDGTVNYKLIMMIRDPVEIVTSHDAWFEHGATMSPEWYWSYLKANSEVMKARPDMSVEIIKYDDVLAAPKEAFKYLRSKGWPINVKKAKDVIDPNMRTIKLERT